MLSDAADNAARVNGAAVELKGIVLTDMSGGAYTYVKLRDLGQALGFGVSWDGTAGVIRIDTGAAYSDKA